MSQNNTAIASLTVEQISSMDYSSLVGLVRERNRPSGGIISVSQVATHANIGRDSCVLEIGCTTGFASVNLAALTGCRVVGIDINRDSLIEAQRYAKQIGVAELVTFVNADARGLPFSDECFDVVWCSNVTSFIQQKEEAVRQYLRVLKLNGTLAAIPIYYHKTPPAELVQQVSALIGTPIKVFALENWIELFTRVSGLFGVSLLLYYSKQYVYLDRSESISDWVSMICNKPHLLLLDTTVRQVLRSRLEFCMQRFNENLLFCAFSILLWQKRRFEDEVELFLAVEA